MVPPDESQDIVIRLGRDTRVKIFTGRELIGQNNLTYFSLSQKVLWGGS